MFNPFYAVANVMLAAIPMIALFAAGLEPTRIA
jgi:hypothetical protein